VQDFIAELRPKYLELLATHLRDLHALIPPLSPDQAGRLRLTAHTLAGSGGTYGYLQLSELALAVEEAPESELWSRSRTLVAEIERAIAAGA